MMAETDCAFGFAQMKTLMILFDIIMILFNFIDVHE